MKYILIPLALLLIGCASSNNDKPSALKLLGAFAQGATDPNIKAPQPNIEQPKQIIIRDENGNIYRGTIQ